MKLFTIFTSDDRALDHVAQRSGRAIDDLVKRVANHQEWGVRVVLDRAARHRAPKQTGRGALRHSGVGYLAQKEGQRDASIAAGVARARHGRRSVRSSGRASRRREARGRASELPAQGGPLLLDAAFLVPRARAATFKALARP